MNEIELMQTVLSHAFPTARITLAKPLNPDGFWSMDTHLHDGYHIAIDWREASGFGLTSDAEHGYGEAADEHFRDFAPAVMRVFDLITRQAETVPIYTVKMMELRQKLKLSQQEVAERMGVNQAAVSKFESRSDSRVSTIQSYLKALNARLVLKAVLNGSGQEILLAVPESV